MLYREHQSYHIDLFLIGFLLYGVHCTYAFYFFQQNFEQKTDEEFTKLIAKSVGVPGGDVNFQHLKGTHINVAVFITYSSNSHFF